MAAPFDPAKHPTGPDGRFVETVRPEGDVDLGGASWPMAPMSWTRTTPPLDQIELRSTNAIFGEVIRSMRDEFAVDAPYQRDSVWETERRRHLIKAVLTGLPIGAITVARRDAFAAEPLFRVIDGRQRLETVWAFADGDLDVPADWFRDEDLEPDGVDDGGMVRWDGLTRVGRNRIHAATYSQITVDSHKLRVLNADGTYTTHKRSDDEALAFEARLYLDLNQGGVGHTADEIARAERIAASS
jgi:hypothetical protein